MSNIEAVEFYDEYVARQKNMGVNIRHYFIATKLVEYGMDSNSSILEIGCGIGTLTYLLGKKVKKGNIHAYDISPKSIELAKKLVPQKNISFFDVDIRKSNESEKFDFIVFPDVLEHIPVEEHSSIFEKIKDFCHEDTVIFINIPHPDQINILKKTKPELMQIIDQALPANHIINLGYSIGMTLLESKANPLTSEHPDYHYYCFKTHKDYTNLRPLPKKKISIKKLMLRLAYSF